MADEIFATPINDHPKVAVLMAAYNGEKHISEQIDCILMQNNVRVALYIRDDRSSDNTTAVIAEYMQKCPNIFLLPTMPEQLRVTKNFYSIVRDIDLHSVDYMSYADQDDIWLPDKLSAAIRAMHLQHTDCYASNLMMGDPEGNVVKPSSMFKKILAYLLNRKSNSQKKFDHYFEAASAGCTLVLNKKAALYFQKRVTDIYDRLPSDASHDWSTYAITKLANFVWYIDERSYIIYRQHADNAYGANLGMGGIKKLMDLFTSGWYRRHILMVEDLYNIGNIHPDFIQTLREYKISSFVSRLKVAFAISGHRRKFIHRIMLFFLVLLGYLK